MLEPKKSSNIFFCCLFRLYIIQSVRLVFDSSNFAGSWFQNRKKWTNEEWIKNDRQCIYPTKHDVSQCNGCCCCYRTVTAVIVVVLVFVVVVNITSRSFSMNAISIWTYRFICGNARAHRMFIEAQRFSSTFAACVYCQLLLFWQFFTLYSIFGDFHWIFSNFFWLLRTHFKSN